MNENLYGYLGMGFAFGFLVLILILLIVIIKQGYKTKHVQMRSTVETARNEEYRMQSEQSLQLLHEIKEGQNKLVDELMQLRTRVSSIEKMIREVE